MLLLSISSTKRLSFARAKYDGGMCQYMEPSHCGISSTISSWIWTLHFSSTISTISSLHFWKNKKKSYKYINLQNNKNNKWKAAMWTTTFLTETRILLLSLRILKYVFSVFFTKPLRGVVKCFRIVLKKFHSWLPEY